ncbi:hypothetical protein XELAEV_18005886mg [Xenopus laevis]|uniref:Uncharacterized protein n=1 Tax=Xenopus laevis TaxID=8355 RepID=A0A974I3K2_XENLA|nr:hypothetical protein XELAEV_18005886mg [Xenopus laevis]
MLCVHTNKILPSQNGVQRVAPLLACCATYTQQSRSLERCHLGQKWTSLRKLHSCRASKYSDLFFMHVLNLDNNFNEQISQNHKVY